MLDEEREAAKRGMKIWYEEEFAQLEAEHQKELKIQEAEHQKEIAEKDAEIERLTALTKTNNALH